MSNFSSNSQEKIINEETSLNNGILGSQDESLKDNLLLVLKEVVSKLLDERQLEVEKDRTEFIDWMMEQILATREKQDNLVQRVTNRYEEDLSKVHCSSCAISLLKNRDEDFVEIKTRRLSDDVFFGNLLTKFSWSDSYKFRMDSFKFKIFGDNTLVGSLFNKSVSGPSRVSSSIEVIQDHNDEEETMPVLCDSLPFEEMYNILPESSRTTSIPWPLVATNEL
jgi:hypothetical protein